ncbi:MAG: DUF2339 domain-containing protein, partial [Deferribacteraceae bacterium]|nr:DUF2339 domain-containing protein [Deferribacteraceae bacterium]
MEMLVLVIIVWFILVTVGSIVALSHSGTHRREISELKREIFSLSNRLRAAEKAASYSKEEFTTVWVPESEPIQDVVDAEAMLAPAMVDLTEATPLGSSETSQEITQAEESISIGRADPAPTPATAPQSSHTATPTGSKTIDALLGFLRGGNIWVTLGVIFVVLGLAFTYKYVASIYHVPDALKIAAGMLVGVGLFAVGWRQRSKRHTFAMVVQGGGIGIFYLSLFASAKIYAIFPISVVFALIAVLVALAVLISVLQA